MLLLLSPRCIWYNLKIIFQSIPRALTLKRLYFLLTAMAREKDRVNGNMIYILALESALTAQNGLTMSLSHPIIILFWNIFSICHRLQLIKMKTNIYYSGIMSKLLLQKKELNIYLHRKRIFIPLNDGTITESFEQLKKAAYLVDLLLLHIKATNWVYSKD